MDFTLPIDEPPLALTAVYKDRKGNPTGGPAGVSLTWSDSDPTVAAIDGTSGSSVNISPAGSTPGSTTAVAVTDGTLSASAVVTLTPGKPASLDIQPAPLT